MALTKAEIAEALFDQLGLNKREARELVDLFFEELRASLSTGEQVKLSGFGNFDLRGDSDQRPPRRDVSTGTKTESSSRGVCWNQAITANCPRSPASATSRSVK
jgi:integration host factor subunit alpha